MPFDTTDLGTFRTDIRAWLAENCPAEMRDSDNTQESICWGGKNWVFSSDAQRLWLERAAVAPSEPDWSDLDPHGTAFDYTDQDWRRLVFSFGETGELIHPRFEAGAPRRSAGVNVPTPKVSPPVETTAKADKPAAKAETNAEAETAPRQPDDPGVLKVDTDDLAERLDSLLGDKPKR